jgi:hypothetical protein
MGVQFTEKIRLTPGQTLAKMLLRESFLLDMVILRRHAARFYQLTPGAAGAAWTR